MATLKRDWFDPHVRFTHRFGESAKNDQVLGKSTFEVKLPLIGDGPTPAATRRKQGEHAWYPPMSPTVKPSGVQSSFNGPNPDKASLEAYPTPPSTRGRSTGGVRGGGSKK